jgi:hypothetical protein
MSSANKVTVMRFALSNVSTQIKSISVHGRRESAAMWFVEEKRVELVYLMFPSLSGFFAATRKARESLDERALRRQLH